jgi:hypothetical protein
MTNESNWLPIESAPRDGTLIIALTEYEEVEVEFWDNSSKTWYNWPKREYIKWIPIPPIPDPTKGAAIEYADSQFNKTVCPDEYGLVLESFLAGVKWKEEQGK